ncbi:SymE family type I addiction module toxin [Caballeronia sp. LZ008]|uniref:SymE family type I addiction module toxin n=1 Tax=unclassified Caballeronia TaxID=2646786 RepID=UPI002029027E|nr:SymE family type I addiction module toxin [Caballeronia sp. LZ008]MDR5795664.1 SymE family type I addiction module toxin [Caballeronia sp. LZ008]
MTVQQSQRESRSTKPYWQRTEPPCFPRLKLAGRWIEQAGFTAGQRVKVMLNMGG